MPATSQPSVPAQAPLPVNGDNPERAVAWKFAQVFIAQTGSDINALAAKLAGNPIVAKYFTINSPEVVNALMGQAVPA
jgi:hypothetical protein